MSSRSGSGRLPRLLVAAVTVGLGLIGATSSLASAHPVPARDYITNCHASTEPAGLPIRQDHNFQAPVIGWCRPDHVLAVHNFFVTGDPYAWYFLTDQYNGVSGWMYGADVDTSATG